MWRRRTALDIRECDSAMHISMPRIKIQTELMLILRCMAMTEIVTSTVSSSVRFDRANSVEKS